MKKLLIILLIIGGFVGYNKWFKNELLNDYPLYTLAANNDLSGELILVNREYAFKGVPSQLVDVTKGSSEVIRVMDDMKMEPVVYEAMLQMAEAAVQDGITTLQLNSAYRSADSQRELFEKHGEAYALPANHSEHQTGLAVDIGVTTGKLEGTEAAAWLEQNATEYGFVLRYPAHKIDITEIEFEPWHFRYVGLPHSVIMQEQDLTLEEYIAYIQKEKLFKYVYGLQEYIVQYAQTDESTIELDVPAGQYTSISSDNVNGIIVTTLVNNQ